MNYKYRISVVTAVYNVESFIGEAIESVISQDIGFKENVQLILVDCGSTDSSGKICDEYAEKYPDNILVIHKENGGVRSARNMDLETVSGEFVSFLGGDDKFAPDAFGKVYRFFSKNKQRTDIVSIPLMCYKNPYDRHMLNYKYNSGTRVIDLKNDYSAVQLSLGSAFIRREALKNFEFDTNLSDAEAAKLINTILLEKHTLGVVADTAYLYRKRNTDTSALQQSAKNKCRYFSYLENFDEYIFDYSKAKLGYIPKFVQYTVAYDLQWRLKMRHLNSEVLTPDEMAEYRERIFALYRKTDDDIIYGQKYISDRHKILILQQKYNCNSLADCNNFIRPEFNSEEFLTSKGENHLEFLRVGTDSLVIEGAYRLCPLLNNCTQPVVLFNNEVIKAEIIDRTLEYSMDIPLGELVRYSVKLNLDGKRNTVRFGCMTESGFVRFENVSLGQFFPLSYKFKNASYTKNGYLFTFSGNDLQIERSNFAKQAVCEIKFDCELFKSNESDTKKSIIVRAAVHILKLFKRRQIWLVSDRIIAADDNGLAFFKYLISLKNKKIKPIFVLSKNSKDWREISRLGETVDALSLKHIILHRLSDYNISSSADDILVTPGHYEPYRDIMFNTKFVFLQHGVTKDDLSGWLNRFNMSCYGFTTSAKREYDSIVEGKYFYSGKEVWLTGLARHDLLYDNSQKIITIMPTWRKYLMSGFNVKKSIWDLNDGFKQSDYFRFYNSLINSPKLAESLKMYGYTLQFAPHPNIQPYVREFDNLYGIKFVSFDKKYRDIFAESDLIITDYSSVAFDFSYLRKPVIYAQFDRDEFFSGNHAYKKGYFDYERDGFGEVEYTEDDVIDRIIEYIKNDCRLKDKYRERIDNFFAFNDKNNCRRIYNKIIEMQETDMYK